MYGKEPFMSAIRMHFKNDIHFVINRCEHEMFLLLATEQIIAIIQCRALYLFCDGT